MRKKTFYNLKSGSCQPAEGAPLKIAERIRSSQAMTPTTFIRPPHFEQIIGSTS